MNMPKYPGYHLIIRTKNYVHDPVYITHFPGYYLCSSMVFCFIQIETCSEMTLFTNGPPQHGSASCVDEVGDSNEFRLPSSSHASQHTHVLIEICTNVASAARDLAQG